MEAAIAASLADLEDQEVVIGSWTDNVERGSAAREDEHAPEHVCEGKIVQVQPSYPAVQYLTRAVLKPLLVPQFNSLDQHSKVWHEMISSLNAPKSSCGAFSCANAVVLSRLMGQDEATVLDALLQQGVVEPEVRKAMEFISESRKDYIRANKGDFKSPREESSYVSAWAANYEISDYMRLQAKPLPDPNP